MGRAVTVCVCVATGRGSCSCGYSTSCSSIGISFAFSILLIDICQCRQAGIVALELWLLLNCLIVCRRLRLFAKMHTNWSCTHTHTHTPKHAVGNLDI